MKLLKVTKITKLNKKRVVYDLTVKENNNFMIGKTGILTHNCDFLSPNAQAALRNIMETFSRHTRFILTCNHSERIIDPIQSRCQVFKVIPPSKKDVAVRVSEILSQENTEYKPEDIVTIINSGYPDIRRIINSVQRQTVNGVLKVDVYAMIANDYKLKVIEHLKTDTKVNAFKNIRQLLADSQIQDYTDLYKLLYDEVEDYAKGHVAPCILLIADAQSTDTFAIDKEIHVCALIIKILTEIKEG
jgi:replication factor C small subunit